MNKTIYSYIDRIYKKKDYEIFREKSQRVPLYLEKLIHKIKGMSENVITSEVKNDPAIELWIYFKDYKEEKLSIEYRTILKISKIADVFVFQHEFCVENRDPNRMDPVLDGFRGEPYIFEQDKMEKEITQFLMQQGLEKLKLSELYEVVENIRMPENSIFGRQMTVENALFRDLYDILE